MCQVSKHAEADTCIRLKKTQAAITMEKWYCALETSKDSPWCKRQALLAKMKAVPYGAPLDAARKAERQKLMDEYMAMLRKPPPSAEGGKSGPSPASLIEKEIANAKNAYCADLANKMIPYCKEDATPAVSAV